MCHVDERHPYFFLERLELDLERFAELGVERSQRLIEQEDRGVQDERSGQRHALLLAARQLRGASLLHAPHANEREGLAGPVTAFLLGDALVPEPERDVVLDGEEWKQRVALEHGVDLPLVRWDAGHVHAIEQDRSTRGLLEARDQPQRRRLAASGWAQEREELTALDREVEPVDGRHLVEALDQVDQTNFAP